MKILRSAKGFSLIEVLLSLFIIGILLILYQAANSTWILNQYVKDQDIALRIASTKLADLRYLGYDALPASGPFSDPLLNSLKQGQATVTVATYSSKIKQVLVTVAWKRLGGTATSTVSLTTLMRQGGL